MVSTQYYLWLKLIKLTNSLHFIFRKKLLLTRAANVHILIQCIMNLHFLNNYLKKEYMLLEVEKQIILIQPIWFLVFFSNNYSWKMWSLYIGLKLKSEYPNLRRCKILVFLFVVFFVCLCFFLGFFLGGLFLCIYFFFVCLGVFLFVSFWLLFSFFRKKKKNAGSLRV